MVNYITKVKQSRSSEKYLKNFQFNYRVIRKNALLRISNGVLQRHPSIKFTKVQYGKMCYKNERILLNKSVLIADQKQNKKTKLANHVGKLQ